MARDDDLGSICPHCRAEGSRYLGTCVVCDRAVCDHCGNVQIVSGERRITHRECLRQHDDGFKMIKFVR